MKRKTIAMLAILALLVVGTVIGVYAAADEPVDAGECSAQGGFKPLRGCDYFCSWCPMTNYHCDGGGYCC